MDKQKKQRKAGMWRGNVFTMLLTSYFIVLLIPLIIFFGLYKQIEKVMIDNAEQSNLAIIEQVKQVVDNQLDEMKLITRYIVSHPKLGDLLRADVPQNGQDRYVFIEFMEEMKRYLSSSNFISDFYLYLKESDVVLTPTMKTDPETIFSQIYGYHHWTYEQWKAIVLDEVHYHRFLPAAHVSKRLHQNRKIIFLQSLPFGEKQHPLGTLVMFIDESQITQLLGQVTDSGMLVIKDRLGQVIVKAGGDVNTQLESAEQNDDLMIASTRSSSIGWEYISVVPKEVVLSKVYHVKKAALSIFFICIIAGVAVCLYLSYRSYRPLKEIISQIAQFKFAKGKCYADEYEFIKTAVARSLEKQVQLEEQLKKQKPVIRANFLTRLMQGNVDLTRHEEMNLSFLGITFPYDQFSIALIKLLDIHEFAPKGTEADWALIRFVIGKVAEEQFSFTAYAVELEKDMMAVVVNFPEKESSTLKTQWANQVQQTIKNRFKTEIAIATSGMHQHVSNIPAAYHESLKALDYSVFIACRPVVHFEEMKDKTRMYYDFPVETEAKLINAVKSGNVKQVKEVMERLYHSNFTEKQTAPELGRILFANLLSTLFKLLNALNVRYEELFDPKEMPLESLYQVNTVDEWYELILFCFEMVCSHVNKQRETPSSQLLQKIKQYIHDNGTDPMISLVTIADQFQITPQYLSAFFKKQSGSNITDYLAQVRIERAKKLMQDPEMTITQISQMVGYNNNVSFIRVFKRHEGITPGKYKEMLHAGEINQSSVTNAYRHS